MPFVTPQSQRRQYDVIVVGSGAAGGQSAYTLRDGRRPGPDARGGPQLRPGGRDADVPDERRGAASAAPARRDKPFGFYDATVDGGWKVPGEPYTNASTEEDAGRFKWWRARMLGGRTNHWGRIALRNGPYDFKPQQPRRPRLRLADRLRGRRAVLRQGRDADRRLRHQRGPREHARLAGGLPAAAAQGEDRRAPRAPARPQARHPGDPDPPGGPHPAARPPDDPGEAASRATRRPSGSWPRTCRAGPPASGRRRAGAGARSAPTTSRRPCTSRRRWPRATWTSSRTRWCARSRWTRRAGPTGVAYIDKTTGGTSTAPRRASSSWPRAPARRSACCSIRSQAGSRTASRTRAALVGQVHHGHGRRGLGRAGRRSSRACPRTTRTGPAAHHVYVPWWLYKEQKAGKLGFARGYHVEFGAGRRMPGGSDGRRARAAGGPDELRREAQGGRPPLLRLLRVLHGTRRDDPQRRLVLRDRPERSSDKWGIPVLRFHWKWSEHEIRQAAHMQRTFADWIEAMGGMNRRRPSPTAPRRSQPAGSIIHEVGGDHHGSRPRHLGHELLVARPGTCRTSSSPTAACSPRTPTRTRRSRSWRSPGARPTTSSSACGARSCDGSAHDGQVDAGGERGLAGLAAGPWTGDLRRRRGRGPGPGRWPRVTGRIPIW